MANAVYKINCNSSLGFFLQRSSNMVILV